MTHQVSTSHFPHSSGHAEAAVKAVKRLVQEVCTRDDIDTDQFQQGLLKLRNSPRADGLSPAQVLYGRPLRSAVPAHHRAFADVWQRAAEECDEKAAVKSQTAEYYDRSARSLRPLRVSQQVLLQDPKTGLWDRTGTIVGVGNRRDYLIRLPSGRTYWRNRRYLRPCGHWSQCRRAAAATAAATARVPEQTAAAPLATPGATTRLGTRRAPRSTAAPPAPPATRAAVVLVATVLPP